jgi:predicted permease
MRIEAGGNMVHEWMTRVRFIFKRRPDGDLEQEMREHLERLTEMYMDQGLDAGEARRRAMVEFGGVEKTREQCEEVRPGQGWDKLKQDLRYTFRTLKRDRGFTFVAVLILALGIGANLVVFSVVNTILLRPLPFHHANELIWIMGSFGKGGLPDTCFGVEAWDAYRRNNKSLENVSGYIPYLELGETKLMQADGDPRPVSGVWVLQDFFSMLGVEPAMGRQFAENDAVKGAAPVVMLSDAFWRNQFHSDPQIIGKTIRLDKDTRTVVAVLPANFDFGAVFNPGAKMDYFVPVVPDNVRDWGHTLALVGRMKPGVSVQQAEAEAKVLLPNLRETLKLGGITDYEVAMVGLKEHVSGKLHRSLVLLWGAVGLILLIGCVNLSNLLLARAASRKKEFALRVALGAGRGRLVRQLLTESLVLSATGAVLGLALAYAATTYLAHQSAVDLPLMSMVRVNGAVLAWTIVLAVGVGLVLGLLPGLKISAEDLQAALKDQGLGRSGGHMRGRLRTTLVISEVAMACVLLAGAGLLLRSFLQVLQVDLGFEPKQVSSIRMDYQPNYDDSSPSEQRASKFQEAIRQMKAIPGVESVAITDSLPFELGRSWDLRAKGRAHKDGDNLGAMVSIVTPGYLQTMGMRLKAGRDFTWDDSAKSDLVIIINQAAARREWPGQDPIGKLAQGIGDKNTRVVGVIDDVHETSAEEAASPSVFVPVSQSEPEKAEVVMRSTLPTEILAPGALQRLRAMNPEQAIVPLKPVQVLIDRAAAPRKFFAMLVGIFAALGLILASLGIYGVISYAVTQQTQEIGIRMALGATRERVRTEVMVRTLKIAVLGVAIGTAASLVVARGIQSLLFGTTAGDPVPFVGMIVLLLGVALLAGYIPARRASRIDPMVAMRSN